MKKTVVTTSLIRMRITAIAGAILVGMGTAGLYGCDDSTQDKNNQTASTTMLSGEEIDASALPLESLMPVNWPFIDDTGQLNVAGDLLASNYYVILDGSGSMGGRRCSGGQTKMDAAKYALKVFSSGLPVSANLGMLAFDTKGIFERLPLGVSNRQPFVERVNAVTARSGTPLKTALEQAYTKLTEQGKKQLGYGEYHLVVVTDGDASSGENPVEIVNEIFQESPVILHTIGFCIDEQHSLNQPGKTYYKAANNPRALQAALDSVLAELDSFEVNAFVAQ